MFNTPQLEEVAQEVEDTIVKIVKEAAQETEWDWAVVLSNMPG